MITKIDTFVQKGTIFDTHAHYDDEAFAKEEKTLFAQLEQYGVLGGITCGCDLESSNHAIALTQNTNWYAAVGFHPENLPQNISEIDAIKPLLANGKVVSVGEIGLDYHWNLFSKEHQIKCFERQIEIAKEFDLPVIVHDREAHSDVLDILKNNRPKGVVHCFSGSVETAKEIVALGMYIGVGGVVTFKNAKKCVDVVKEIPLERLLLETDAPYLTPEPYRGHPNHSGMIYYTAQKIAEIKGAETADILNICNKSAFKLFNI